MTSCEIASLQVKNNIWCSDIFYVYSLEIDKNFKQIGLRDELSLLFLAESIGVVQALLNF